MTSLNLHEQIALICGRETDGQCGYCQRGFISGHELLRETRDHIIPLGRKGMERPDNIIKSCYHCNHLKGGMTPDRWLAFIETHPAWWVRFPKPTASARRRVGKAANRAFYKLQAKALMPPPPVVALDGSGERG